jgi:mannose-6-phosphate isomerase class I
VVDQLAEFTPKPGDGIFLRAGTVHALGGDIVVFEIQQNSDVTFRLYDWDHLDAKTGKPRSLQVDQAIACIDFAEGPVGRVAPVVEATTPVNARNCFTVNISGYGACADSRRFPSAPQVCRACWYASTAVDRSSTEVPLTLSQKAMYFCCRR